MPPIASSTFPGRRRSPRPAGAGRPKSSSSRRLIEEQSTTTYGPEDTSLCRCSAIATRSFPVPTSPDTRTGARDLAIRGRSRTSLRITSEAATISDFLRRFRRGNGFRRHSRLGGRRRDRGPREIRHLRSLFHEARGPGRQALNLAGGEHDPPLPDAGGRGEENEGAVAVEVNGAHGPLQVVRDSDREIERFAERARELPKAPRGVEQADGPLVRAELFRKKAGELPGRGRRVRLALQAPKEIEPQPAVFRLGQTRGRRGHGSGSERGVARSRRLVRRVDADDRRDTARWPAVEQRERRLSDRDPVPDSQRPSERLLPVHEDRFDAPENVQKIAAVFFDNSGVPSRHSPGSDHHLVARRCSNCDQRSGNASDFGISRFLTNFQTQHSLDSSSYSCG